MIRSVAIGAAAGALAGVLACSVDSRSGAAGTRLELQELATALAHASTRPIEGRLSGGFPYAPPPASTRGLTRGIASPDIRIAAARLEKAAAERPTPRTLAAMGVGYLTVGEWDRAVEALQDAVSDAPDVSAYQSDLSAAYLARASDRHRAEDWVRALAAADRALRMAPEQAEALFNRALSLRGLHLRSAEAEAWADVARVEPTREWRDDAARYRKAALDRTVPADATAELQHQRAEADRQIGLWAKAYSARNGDEATRALGAAEHTALALEGQGGDTMAADEVRLIRRLERHGNQATLARLAHAHVIYLQVVEESAHDRLDAASALMADAAVDYRAAGSAFVLWQPIVSATALRHQKAVPQALDGVRRVRLADVPVGYRNLRGRLARMEGVLWGGLLRFDQAREPLRRAIGELEPIGETEPLISAQTLLAEADWFLGDTTSAWTNVLSVAERIDVQERRSGEPSTASYYLTIGATVAKGQDLPEVALDFINARVKLTDTPRAEGYGYLLRGRLLAQIGDRKAAAADLAHAAGVFARISDAGLREETSTDVAIARAELLRDSDCPEAIRHVDTALPSVRRAVRSIRVVGLLAVRAKCRQALGDLDGASADLADAAASFEEKRRTFASAMTRIEAFEEERRSFKDLVTLEAVTRRDERAGLRSAERSRAGVLAEQWRVDFDATDERRLPAGVAVIYYELLDDRVLMWVLSRNSRVVLQRPVGALQVARRVDRIQRAVAADADVDALAAASREFTNDLLTPALAAADASGFASTVFIVPDGPLFQVPFGALPDVSGQPLIRRRTIGITPSLAAFHAASDVLSTFQPLSVVAVGDGHDPLASGLPRLPGADEEAARVGRLYPTSTVLVGPAATRARMLRERPAVLHFAGHTVVNERFPMYSQLLLAPDPAHGDPGGLLGGDITAERFSRTRVVVLATCDGAAGRVVEGEGAISVARTFFSAGVPAVVASLWPVPDDVSEFAETFHRELRTGRDSARALRAAQLAVLDARGVRAPVRMWGGFIVFGGMTTHR
jgi:CHAT domain-containing protein